MEKMPMAKVHPFARLYKKFTERDTFPLNPEELQSEEEYNNWALEMNNYVHFKKLIWQFDGDIQFTQDQPMPGMICRGIYCAIRTNTHHAVEAGDIIWLNSKLIGGPHYFTVTGEPKQEHLRFSGAEVPSFKRIELRSLM